jgi:sialate O-acetylesterase
MKYFFISLLSIFLISSAQAQLKTARLFSDHMVLQRNKQIPVWGWADKKARVKVNLNGQTIIAKANEQGYWTVVFKPMKEGGPYTLTILSKKEKLVYNDVMLGEVWICSGQSNMEFAMKNADGYRYQQKIARKQAIREFDVPKKISLKPEKELSGGQWLKADTGTVGNFTAVGYYFAVKLSQRMHVTVGLINDNWGGTEIEDWISKDAMLTSPGLDSAAQALPTDSAGLKARLDKQLQEYTYQKNPVVFYTADQLAAEHVSFFNNWPRGGAGTWQWQGRFYSYKGNGFMQRTIKLDSLYTGYNSVLRFGTSDADLAVYINGQQIKNLGTPGNYQINLPAGTWRPGDNSLLVELRSEQKNPSWYGLGINGDVTNFNIKIADTTISLMDNWHLMADLSKPYHYDYQPNNTGFMLFNAMINPIIPYAVAGVLWYQGESNAGRAYQYRTALPLLISDWRSRWKDNFPFFYVQLPSFGGTQGSGKGSNWAELREAQTMTLKVPNTGMIVTTDLADPNNLHPKNKADFGYRLAGKVLSTVYGDTTGYHESPIYRSAVFKDGYALIEFNNADNGLMVKDKYGYIKGFEVAGADHKFYYAQAMIVDHDKVKVWCSQVNDPVAVRYAWTDAPFEANLFNKEGMPVNSFRSDNWKGITEGSKFK